MKIMRIRRTNATNVTRMPQMPMDDSTILYKELCYELNGIFFKAQNDLGRFCRERQYGDVIEQLLKDKMIAYQREFPVPLPSDNGAISNRVDFLIHGLIIVELKAKRFITRDDYLQIKRYLEATQCQLGLLVNFQGYGVRIKRVVLSME